MVVSIPALKQGTHHVSKRGCIRPVTLLHFVHTCINEEDGRTGKGRGIKPPLVLREVAPHHRTQNETDAGGCVEVSHHQRAL